MGKLQNIRLFEAHAVTAAVEEPFHERVLPYEAALHGGGDIPRQQDAHALIAQIENGRSFIPLLFVRAARRNAGKIGARAVCYDVVARHHIRLRAALTGGFEERRVFGRLFPVCGQIEGIRAERCHERLEAAVMVGVGMGQDHRELIRRKRL